MTLRNKYAGKYKTVLTVCSANQLRSPTAAEVLAQPPFSFNTRSCGTDPRYAVVPLTARLLRWADEVVCMEPEHARRVQELSDGIDALSGGAGTALKIITLYIPDDYNYKSLILKELIARRYKEVTGYAD